jgi:hypothetical protein
MVFNTFKNRLTTGQSLIQSELQSRRWFDFVESLPTRDDVINLLIVMEDICQFHMDPDKPLVIDYQIFKQLEKDNRVNERIRQRFLCPDLFMKMPKFGHTQIAVTTLVSFICRALMNEGLYGSLAQFSIGDTTSQYIMTIDAVEDWLFRLSRRLVQIQKMTEQFLPLWIFTAAHTIAFFHGKQQTSKVSLRVPGSDRISSISIRIPIQEFVESNTMNQLLQLSRATPVDSDTNPFARIRAVRYYDSFTVFDTSDGLCPIFSGGYMNPIFIERLLAIHGGGQTMDYRRFLSFSIAWDGRKTVPGVKYFWPLIDHYNRGYITRNDIEELANGILTVIRALPAVCGPQGADSSRILIDEICDIFSSYLQTKSTGSTHRPTDSVLSLKEALEAPVAFGTVVGLLGNSQTFLEYECREETAHKLYLNKQWKDVQNARAKASTETRTGQLAQLQKVIDETMFFDKTSSTDKFATFADFLDYHESLYGGEAMEPWLNRYYAWEAQEEEAARNCASTMSETSSIDISNEIQTRE